jgi:hypothetical protein
MKYGDPAECAHWGGGHFLWKRRIHARDKYFKLTIYEWLKSDHVKSNAGNKCRPNITLTPSAYGCGERGPRCLITRHQRICAKAMRQRFGAADMAVAHCCKFF